MIPREMKCLIKLFAEDAKLYKIIITDLNNDHLKIDIGKSKEWAIICKMLFYHTKKCKHLHRTFIRGDYYMPSKSWIEPTEKAEEETESFVLIDSKWNFRQHIAKKVTIANRNLGIIYRTFTQVLKSGNVSKFI